MSERRNHLGAAYSLTVIAPIVAGREPDARDAIAALPVGAASPLARLETLHFSRVHVVSELVFQGPPQRFRDRLRSSQLVFTSTFDGELDPYLHDLRSGAEPDVWWQYCVGYPGSADRAAFERFVRDHQIDSSLFASAHPSATVPGVLESLALREQIVAFAADAQGLDAATLHRRFRERFAS
jgi:hypothetical protein